MIEVDILCLVGHHRMRWALGPIYYSESLQFYLFLETSISLLKYKTKGEVVPVCNQALCHENILCLIKYHVMNIYV